MRRFTHSPPPTSPRYAPGRQRYDIDGDEVHYPTRPVDKDKAEQELTINIKKATSPEETAPKQKLIVLRPSLALTRRLAECIVYTWDYHSSISIWQGLRVQPILSDEVQTFKALITVHKLLQEGHPVVRFSCFLCPIHRY
jgi:huntingtin-interacting protein 1-related protein